ncbi:MAG TPA: hypothetical protein VK171_07040 [Fimbriimonas sp.]|nr:hypothetical protein [Fimbriimonas sp.]
MDSWEPVDERRRQYAERAAKKFTSFRRSLVPPGKETTPEWSNKRNAPLLLAGKWDRNFEGDQELVSLLTGALFDVENEHAIDLSKATDALFVQTGSIIAVADPEDGWTYLGRHINDKHLTAFIDAILTAFKETDPQYEFDDPNESSALAMYPDRKGKLRYSLSLRQGLAESLCYLGANGEEINVTGVTRGDIVATLVVRKLFGQATTWKHFCSMAPWFREMAEASPDEFLTALEKTIKGQPEKVASLFRDKSQDFFFGGSSAHTTLLWALEILAWSPEHVTRVAIILAKLSHLDPGGRTANRPESSLRSIFIPWYPGTLADTKHRQDCLKKIASFDSKLCFALLVKLLPTGHSFAMPNARAKYRPWGPLWQLPLTYGDIWTATDDITELAIECAGSDAANWVKIIESISEFRQVGFDNAIAGLGKYLECAGPEDLALVRESVRKLLAQHTSHPSAEWIMSNERLEKLQEILAEIPIKDSVEKWKWAFSDHAIFELGPGNDFAAKQLELNALQAKAVQEIYDEARLMGLLNLAASSSTPWNVGFAVSKIEIKETLDEAVAASCSAGESGILFALGLANSVANHSGWEIVWKLISSSWGVAQDVSLVARFLALIPFSRETMARLSEMSIDIQEQYWGRFDPFQFIRGDHDRELSESALAELCKFDRFATAVKGLGWIVRDGERILNPEIILTTLEGALRSQEMRPEHWSGLTHELGEILDVLDKARVDSSRLGWLEMNFSNLLSFTRKPKHLNRLVSDDPSLFVLLLSAVYKSKLEVDPQADTSIPPMVAYEVLKGLETLPGQIDKTTIDGRKLLDWVKEGQVLAKEIGRQEVFEENLGEWFAHSPPGEDGIKPHEAVREVFQVLESKHLEDGYSIGVYNSRGVVSKHPEEGGEQERELGEAFKKAADALASKWHRVALALTRISASYYDEAKREDLRKGLD